MSGALLRLRTTSWTGALAVAAAATLAAALLRLGIGLVVPFVVPFATFFLSTIAAALVAGLRGGLLATVFATIVSAVLVYPSESGWELPTAIANLTLFAVVAAAMVFVTAAMREAVDDAAIKQDRLTRTHQAGAIGDWSWDLRTGAVTWSPELYDLLGLSPERVPPSRDAFVALIHPDDVERARAEMVRAIERDTRFDLSMRLVHPQRGVRHFVSRGEIVRDAAGTATSVIGVNMDVTERREAELQRDAALSRLASAMQVAEMGVYDVDLAAGTVSCSDSLDLIYGLDPDRAEKRVADYTGRIAAEDVDGVVAAVQSAGSHVGPLGMEYRVIRADGSVRWVASRGAVLTDGAGRRRLVGAVFDTTERKTLEIALAAARDRAETLFREMNHRIKNNLQMVVSLLRLQESRLADEGARAALRAAGERIANIADLHTSFYRSDDVGEIDFAGFIEELAVRTASSLPADRIIRIETRVDPVRLPGDLAVPLGLIANELMTNALKHAFAGRSEGVISLRLAAEPEAVVLTVADDGAGLAEGWSGQRRGLGVRLVDTFVRQIGATLAVDTGQGTRAVIRLPRPGISPKPEPARETV